MFDDVPADVVALLDVSLPPAPWCRTDRLHLEWLMYLAWRNAETAFQYSLDNGVEIWRDGQWQEAEAGAWGQALELRIAPDDEALAHELHRRWFRAQLEGLLQNA